MILCVEKQNEVHVSLPYPTDSSAIMPQSENGRVMVQINAISTIK